jgi:ABC-type nitrate/sulfonate/bicarbonate transport system ATPase subunit
MFPAGDPKQLEVLVKRKAFRTANGDVREILHDFSLTLEAGKIHALVGPSGFGKTTLLRIIIGLDHNFEGRVSLPPETKIGTVFQEPRLLPWRSVLDNLKLAAPQAAEADLIKLANDLGIGDHLRNFPGELSLGQARRVALARALAIEPNLLVLDEPFVSLDSALARRLSGELAALVERTRVTTLLVTHDIDEAIRLADHIILLGHRPAEIVGNIDVSLPRRAMTADYAAKTKALIGAILAENAV